MKRYNVCMTVAGSDPSGGAGIQADLKTMTLLGCYGQAVPTALTVQNSLGVRRCVAVSPQLVYEQMSACMDDMPPRSVKIGIVPNATVARAVSRILRERKPPFVVADPVLVSSSGLHLVDGEGVRALLDELLPLSSLVTPNLQEAQLLAGCDSGKPDLLARTLYGKLRCAVLVKGGHLTGDPTDVLYDGDKIITFPAERVDTRNSHGTGCVLSSAIASFMAQDNTLTEAIRKAKCFLTHALRRGSHYEAGHGAGAMFLVSEPQLI